MTWTPQASGVDADLLAVWFTNAMTGTAVGGSDSSSVILRTTDAGATWQVQAMRTEPRYLRGVFFSDDSTGTVVGNRGTILRTVNGGTTWIEQVSGTTLNNLLGVWFTSRNIGTIVGERGTVLRTEDGGDAWVNQGPIGGMLHGVFFADADTGTVVGELGGVYRTTDGGVTWTTQVSGTFSDLRSVFLMSSQVGIAVGGRTIIRTDDGGTTWRRVSSTLYGAFGHFDVYFSDASTGTVVGDAGTILRTTTGGE